MTKTRHLANGTLSDCGRAWHQRSTARDACGSLRANVADPRVRGALKWLVETGVPVGAVHYCVGQEAVAAGVCAALRSSDWIASTHRGHGHCIAKGVDVRPMMAELYGKATGTNRGKGGSMHITDIRVGVLGVNPIVGMGVASRGRSRPLGEDPRNG